MADNSVNKADEGAEKAYSDAASNVNQAQPSADRTPEAAPAERKAAIEPPVSQSQASDEAAVKTKTSAKVNASAKAKAPAKVKVHPEAQPKPAKKAVRKPGATRKAASGFSARKPNTITTQPAIDNLKDKIMANTKNTNTDFTKNMQDAGTEMQVRMKAAYEKSSEMTGEMSEVAKGNVEALVESSKIMAEGMQSIGRDAAEETKTAFETMTADLKKMAAVQSPTELLQLQGEIARRNFDSMIGYGSKNAESMVKLANDAFAPISNRMSVAAEKISKAA